MRALAVLTALVAALSQGCGTPPPPRFSPVTAMIPADTPFALVVGPIAPASLEHGLANLRGGTGLGAVLRSRLQTLLGIDVSDPNALRETGLDLRGDYAIFALQGRPALLARVADVQAWQAFVDRVRGRAEVSFTERVVDDRVIETVELGASHITFELLDGYVAAVYHHTAEDAESLLAAFENARTTPASDLGRAPAFARALEALGHSDDHRYDAVLIVQTEPLDRALLDAAAPEKDERLHTLSEARRASFLADERRRLEVCAEAGAQLAGQLPYVVAGIRGGPDGVEQRAVAELGTELRSALDRILPSQEGPYARVSDGALASFAVHLDLGALTQAATADPGLIMCPNLAALSGAAAALGRGLGETDAARVFASSIYGVLYDFDLGLPFLTRRSAALLFETRDPAAVVDGFGLLLEGLGAVEGTPDSDGTRRFRAVLGTVGLALVTEGNWVVLVVDGIDRARLASDLQAAPSAEARARFDVDGARLETLLRGVMEAAPLTAGESQLATGLVEAVAGLGRAAWTVGLDQRGLVLDGLASH